MRKPEDKSSGSFDYRWPRLLNVVIETLDFRKLELSRCQYTWANERDPPTFEKLDKVLMSIEWELKYPKASV